MSDDSWADMGDRAQSRCRICSAAAGPSRPAELDRVADDMLSHKDAEAIIAAVVIVLHHLGTSICRQDHEGLQPLPCRRFGLQSCWGTVDDEPERNCDRMSRPCTPSSATQRRAASHGRGWASSASSTRRADGALPFLRVLRVGARRGSICPSGAGDLDQVCIGARRAVCGPRRGL